MVAQAFFLLLVFTPSKAEQPLRCIELQGKEGKKIKSILDSCLQRVQRKVFINSRLKAIKIISQRKGFCWQKIPQPSCPRKETVEIDIFIISRNDDRKSCNLLE